LYYNSTVIIVIIKHIVNLCCLGVWHSSRHGNRGCWVWFGSYDTSVQREKKTTEKRQRFRG